ncbi:GNAT family N-acetyltransferase [Tepidibacillus infernus]|uniref:N-acetyltransferase domain-containing protein n=1 Tax=Tepidibacillus decaturensis TaxID=1413211 RepID=A0A135L5D3_9BACI|nr:GNAT family N-acetyltransferase [Tepidibacillus decaturensis]KXG44222.1 hypothetical protein U473_09565 [Tepidibacillus decaturensis]
MSQTPVVTSIVTRSLKNLEELEKVQELEKLVWGMKEIVPTHQTLTAVKNGGLVLGAFHKEKLVGFQYSFAGFNGKEAYLCSHMLAIHPDYRHQKIGERLKRVQRDEALKLGYRLITWTYDPLESVNANLNIGKLGAITNTYIENAYGEMNDPLNRGLASDRFLVEWWLESSHVLEKQMGKRIDESLFHSKDSLIQWEMNNKGFPVPNEIDITKNEEEYLFIPIPSKFQELKHQDIELAIEWRQKTRLIFIHYFSQGWIVCDFLKMNNEEFAGVHFYVLKRKGE